MYVYQATAKSKRGGHKFRLASGPPGMTVSDAGLIHWMVPSDIAEPHIDVILCINDPSGREVFQPLHITLMEPEP